MVSISCTRYRVAATLHCDRVTNVFRSDEMKALGIVLRFGGPGSQLATHCVASCSWLQHAPRHEPSPGQHSMTGTGNRWQNTNAGSCCPGPRTQGVRYDPIRRSSKDLIPIIPQNTPVRGHAMNDGMRWVGCMASAQTERQTGSHARCGSEARHSASSGSFQTRLDLGDATLTAASICSGLVCERASPCDKRRTGLMGRLRKNHHVASRYEGTVP